MSVYKRGNTWWIKINSNGRVIRRSAKTTSKREAQAFERQLRVQNHASHGITYLDALQMWLPIAPKSMLSHARNTHEIYNIALDKVPGAANRMGNKMLADGLKVTTVNRRLSVVRRVLNLAHKEWDLLDYPLAQKIGKHPESGLNREVFLSKEEVESLVAEMKNPVAKAITLIAAYTGLRRGELLKLRPEQWEPPYISLKSNTKSKKPHTVPLIEELHDSMVLPFDITDWYLRKDFESARKAVGMQHVRLHDLRHTFASWLMSDPNVPITLVRDLLGHSSLTVTSKYSHLRSDTAAAVEGALGSRKK